MMVEEDCPECGNMRQNVIKPTRDAGPNRRCRFCGLEWLSTEPIANPVLTEAEKIEAATTPLRALVAPIRAIIDRIEGAVERAEEHDASRPEYDGRLLPETVAFRRNFESILVALSDLDRAAGSEGSR